MNSFERQQRLISSILDTIEAGDDPQPLITRLYQMQPWLLVQMGEEYADESIKRTRDADERLAD
jgi:hypothetical protein